MKEGGVEHIVFLSTNNIMTDDPRKITMEDPIGFFHAQVEIALEESGVSFVAVRPGFFASNNIKHNLVTSSTPWEAFLMRSPKQTCMDHSV